MKQLKFMLAAATAVGFAAAAQADTQIVNQPVDSEDFELYTTETPFASLTGFSYAGATATDNESAIIAGGATTKSAFALQVNTGTDPILRKLDTENDLAINLSVVKKLYINTMVQFTVTPEGDDVDKKTDDKLMIYLKEVPAVKDDEGTVTTPATTKLMVKAGQYKPADMITTFVPTFVETDVEISNAQVVPGEWYNLEVTSYVENGATLFTIKLGETELVSATALYTDAEKKVFPSLAGTSSTTLDFVGFAGEGKVDDIVITKDVEVETSVDFTFAITRGDGVSAVAWTIDGVAQESLSASVKAGQTIAITDVTYADWYVASGTYVKDWSTEASEDLTAITVSATKTAAVVDGKVEVTESTKPADVGIKTGSFAADTTPVAELNKVLTWATAKAGAAASAAGALVGQLDFTDETETATEQAYLLNCAPTEDAIKAKKDAFVFSAFTFDENGAPVVTVDPEFAGDVNGRIEIRGATSLDAEDAFTAPKKDGDAFFKAFLVK